MRRVIFLVEMLTHKVRQRLKNLMEPTPFAGDLQKTSGVLAPGL